MNDKKVGGRPTKYDPEYHPVLAWSYMQTGLTIEECADKFGFCPATLYNWMKKYPEFKDAMKEGSEKSNSEVESSLYKRAMGYKSRKRKVETDADGDVIKTVIEEVEVVPDTTAQIFWLKNRKPAAWRDKQDLSISGKLETETKTIDYSSLPDDEAKKLFFDGIAKVDE